MKIKYNVLTFLFTLLVSLSIVSCSCSKSRVIHLNLTSIEISPVLNFVPIGAEVQLTAIAIYNLGAYTDIATEVKWSSSNANVISISNNGKLKALAAGSSKITATLNSITTSVILTTNSSALKNIEITPQPASLAKGTSISLSATAIFADNTTQNISKFVTWSSNDSSIADVNNSWEYAGRITGNTTGTATIFASLNNISSSTEITVTDATLIDIFIENFEPNIIIGSQISLEAIGVFSDNSHQNLTDQVLWSSSNNNIATISSNDLNAGKLVSNNIGSSTIRATFNNITTKQIVSVIDATVTSLSVIPSDISLMEGASYQLNVIGLLSNGDSQNLTSIANWESDSPDTLSISNTVNGFITANQAGEANIIVSYDGKSASSLITVTNPTLLSIEIAQQNLQIANDTKLLFNAIGIYSDGTQHDITQDVFWDSDNKQLVTISNGDNTKGIANSISNGSVIISASSGTISGTTKVSVSSKVLESINLTIDRSALLAVGNKVKINAIGNYSDGSTYDISHQVTWRSSNKNICVISSAKKKYAVLKTKTDGICSATAQLKQITGSYTFSISNATLQSMTISPASVSLAKGTSKLFSVTGFYSDNTSSNISGQVSWKTNNALTSIDASSNSGIILRALNPGVSTLTASYNEISTTSTVTVNTAALQSIAISAVNNENFNTKSSKYYNALGTYSDLSTLDITKQVLWTSSDNTIATISNAYDTAGKATGNSPGNMTLAASFKGIYSNQLNVNLVEEPTQAISIALKSSPYGILTDNSDTSIVTLNIQAADSLQSVPDGTEIQLSVVNGSGNLSSNSITTENGIASFNITSTTKSLITIKATVLGTEISNSVSIYATDKFGELIGYSGFVLGSLENGQVTAGTILGFPIYNIANRLFTIDDFSVRNNNSLVTIINDPAILNNNLLPSGGSVSASYKTTEISSNNYSLTYNLSESDTNKNFSVTASITLNQ